ncbi:hypothetical protein [Flavobacterium sp.]|jgi:hypothetical protein|uniref:hypothetical protein n=1 Tax=Flavobacterium sp. TaxID=239 RepID=UPI0037BF1F84
MKKLLFIFGTVLLSSFVSDNNKSFEVKIEIVRNKVQLTPSNGFNFSLMAFTKNSVYLNESGMIDFKNSEEVENSDFIIKLTKRNNKIVLKGIKNTKWKDLVFKNYAIINESGIK